MVDKLHGVARKIVDLIRQVILVGFAFIMIKAGGALVLKQLQAGQTTPVMKLPMSLMYFSLVLAFGLIFVIQTLRWYSRLQNSERKRETGHECRIDFIFDFYSLPGNRGTGVHLLECGLTGGRGVRGPSGLLHAIAQRIFGGLQSSSIMAIVIFCTGWQSYDEGGDFQADCRFCGLPGGQRERRYEPGAGTGLCILCCLIWISPATVIAIGTMLYGDMIKRVIQGRGPQDFW